MYREQLVFYGVIAYGKILIAEFTDKEEQIFNQLVEWLSDTLCTTPVSLSKKCNGLDVGYFTRTVTDTNGNKIHLTAKEFDLLYFLSNHKGQVFTKEQIYENVFGFDAEGDSSVIAMHVKNIRAKLKEHDAAPIETVWGVGYKIEQ